MTTTLLWTLLAAGVAGQPAEGNGTLLKPLFAADKWYQDAKGREKTLAGILQINPGTGRIAGTERFHSFRLTSLEDDKPVMRPIHMNGKDHLLGPYINHQVKFVAKIVESEVGGQKIIELWPAQLEVKGAAKADGLGEREIIARTNSWTSVRRVGGIGSQPQPIVIRDVNQLVGAMNLGIRGGQAEQAALQQMNSLLRQGNPGIDFTKHMLIHVNAGQQPVGSQVQIQRVVVQEKGLDVYWKLTPGNVPNPGLALPSETILIKKSDGEVRFLAEGFKPQVVAAVEEDPPPKNDPPKK